MTDVNMFDDDKPQNKQIGGSHYKSFAIEPWTFVQENNLNPFQSNVIRYACRYKNKGGIQDLCPDLHRQYIYARMLKLPGREEQFLNCKFLI